LARIACDAATGPGRALGLVTNLGRYQDVRLLHLHLLAAAALPRTDDTTPAVELVVID
jgi:hypothetical protein